MFDDYYMPPETEAAAHFWNAVHNGNEEAMRRCLSDADLPIDDIKYEDVVFFAPHDFAKKAADIIRPYLFRNPALH
ncbi:MAG TPA: hypothetical protein PLF01_01670 [Alphaproteobacteria bacterium]|nr:hypothetical protein [Alphaproteobacteria bacterium]